MIRLLLRASLFLLLTSGMFAGIAASAEEPVRIDLTPAQWQEDILFFGQEMARRHRSAFHLTSRAEFERAVEDLIVEALSEKYKDRI
jgi:hypothetical protein